MYSVLSWVSVDLSHVVPKPPYPLVALIDINGDEQFDCPVGNILHRPPSVLQPIENIVFTSDIAHGIFKPLDTNHPLTLSPHALCGLPCPLHLGVLIFCTVQVAFVAVLAFLSRSRPEVFAKVSVALATFGI